MHAPFWNNGYEDLHMGDFISDMKSIKFLNSCRIHIKQAEILLPPNGIPAIKIPVNQSSPSTLNTNLATYTG